MHPEENNIYIVEGEVQLQIIAEFFKKAKQLRSDRLKWCKSQGTPNAITRGDDIVGLLANPSAKIVEGWKRTEKPDMCFASQWSWIPDSRTRLGKSLREQMEALKSITTTDFAHAIGADKVVIRYSCGAVRYMTAQCYQEGSNWILISPKDEKKDVPPKLAGCRLLKTSEYYAIKEASAA